MEVLAARSAPVALAEIAQCLGTSKSGVHSLLAALVRAGYAEHGAGGVYELGLKAWEIGRSVPTSRLLRRAEPIMAQLVAEVEEGAILGVLDGFDVVYVHRVESEQAVRVHASVGDHIPAHCTSTGLALLSALEPAEAERLIPTNLPAITPKTLVDRSALFAELRCIRVRGYAINRGGWRLDVGGIAAPVSIRSGALSLDAGLCVALPKYRMTRTWIGRNAPILIDAAQRIERSIGADRPVLSR